jgi:hypothetical protein
VSFKQNLSRNGWVEMTKIAARMTRSRSSSEHGYARSAAAAAPLSNCADARPNETPISYLNPVGAKVFCVGLQKTGLTSLALLMLECGFNARGSDTTQRRNFFRRRDYDAVLRYYDTADFFCDWPTPLMYRIAYEKYGEKALFILTVRKDSQTWFKSLKRHNAYAHLIKNKHRWIFGRYYPHGFDQEHIAYYERHNREVVRFFEERGARNQLLVVRVDEPQAVAKIAEFLGIKIERAEFPHANASRAGRTGISNWFKWHYNNLIQKLYARYAPRILKSAPRQLVAIQPGTH